MTWHGRSGIAPEGQRLRQDKTALREAVMTVDLTLSTRAWVLQRKHSAVPYSPYCLLCTMPWNVTCQSHAVLISALDTGIWSAASRPVRFTRRKVNFNIYDEGGWVSPGPVCMQLLRGKYLFLTGIRNTVAVNMATALRLQTVKWLNTNVSEHKSMQYVHTYARTHTLTH
jgi:hypothetical protein